MTTGVQPVAQPMRLLTGEFILLGLACLSLLLTSFGRITEHIHISQLRQHVTRAIAALQSIDNLSVLVLGIESSQRGFLLTGSNLYLAPYRTDQPRIASALSELRAASRDISLDQKTVTGLIRVINQKLNEISTVIDINDKKGLGPALAMVKTDLGRQLMDEIFELTKVLKRECTVILARESDQLEKENHRAMWLSTIGSLFVMAVLLAAAFQIYLNFKRVSGLIKKVENGRERYRLLARRLESIKEDERATLARDIHDSLGQTLTVIKMDLVLTGYKLGSSDVSAARTKLEQATASIDGAIRALRKVATELRPPNLDTLGLSAALETYVREMRERTGLQIRFTESGAPADIAPEHRITVFRICQECVTNALRHAAASELAITLRAEADLLELIVQDNGKGFIVEGASDKGSLGLLGMQERAHSVGGNLSIQSRSGSGTTITFRMPIVGQASSATEPGGLTIQSGPR